eukprot:XP_015580371.1 uncharacterized protein LOC107261993 [Ricinus communis]
MDSPPPKTPETTLLRRKTPAGSLGKRHRCSLFPAEILVLPDSLQLEFHVDASGFDSDTVGRIGFRTPIHTKYYNFDSIVQPSRQLHLRRRSGLRNALELRTIEMAGFSLKGIASQWFKNYIRSFLERLLWRQFRDRFEEYFIPFSVRQEYRERFERLIKGDLSVAEYTRQFVQLSRYAPYAVGTAEQKNNKYISRLGPEFVSLVKSRRSSFLEVTNMARQMEMILRGFGQGTDDGRKKKTRVEGQPSA